MSKPTSKFSDTEVNIMITVINTLLVIHMMMV